MGIGSLRRYHGAPKVEQPQATLPEAPAKSAPAAEWKAYAAVRGWDATATKAALVEQYDRDVESRTDAGDERVVSTPTGATTETIPEGVVTASEPEPVGEREQRDADKVGEGVTTAADLTGESPEGDDESTD